MKYFKNSFLAKEYGVTLPTIANWIKETTSGKKNLELFEHNNRKYIAKTDSNQLLMRKYVEFGFKYKPVSKRVVAESDFNFVKYLSDKQLIEIKKDLLDKKHLDLKYVYMDGGAEVWNSMYENSSGSSSTYEPYHKMNVLMIPRILELLGEKTINIIEVGVGNGKPLHDFLHALEKEKKLNSYISIDIRSTKNEIAIKNIKKEYPN